MTTSTLGLIATLLAALLIPALVIAWIFESRTERVRRRRAAGWTQQAIADREGISRHRVRRILATA
jgi:ABC-type uncharacterized transport system permease subunit